MEDVDEGRAREALLDFFQIYTRLRPDRKLSGDLMDSSSTTDYYSYLSFTVLIRRALGRGEYGTACWELGSLCFHEQIMQRRIYMELLDLYHTCLEGTQADF